MNPAVFLDRDGTLIEDRDYLHDPEEIRWHEGALEGLRRLGKIGMKRIIVTNQSGVARGYFDETDVRRVHRELIRQARVAGADIEDIYYCPMHPEADRPGYSEPLDCRKPRPGMLLRAQEDHRIDLLRSYLIGDKQSDLEAASRVGSRGFLVRTGKGAGVESRLDLDDRRVADYVGEAIDRIVSEVDC